MATVENEQVVGVGNMPPLVGKREAASTVQRFFAREGVPPLSHAFEGKIAVHPGLGGRGIPSADMQRHMDTLLAEERSGKTVAYIHVPFCRSHCLYCGFYTKAWREDESARYTDALIAELGLWRGRAAVESGPVHAVYLGGGTPTELAAPDMLRLLEAVRRILPLANDCEITVEGRLSNFDERKMEACLEGGANRFSLGVQSFHSDIRRAMGRIGTREDMARGLERLMGYGQAAVIVDLIYGFPGQDMERWREDLAVAQSLGLDGADCYQLNVYRKTPLGRAIERGEMEAAADIPQQAAMFAVAVESMTRAFWRRLSMSHWARSPRERNIYNLYVKGAAHCLAFGPGAGGNLHGHFYLNNSDYQAWLESVHAGLKPYAMMFRPEPRHYLYKAIAEGMEQGGLDLAELERKYGVAVEDSCRPVLAQWRRTGLVELEEGRLALTLAGQFWQVNLSQLLQEYLKTQLEMPSHEAA
ncbi:heme anaerobic degradation radical SAM methyltransferase ChuW/HutW [uncultured Desulfovibrio sp.]|uniref:heme anaerobic degradation radical SAM methyltransferase ChuW/HutW n=2 Tax=uncultured Desulfovibrio sp. TaxID=167968 RepID=UPI0026129FFC|nr:heme anaerobic degradation radical SAM methyltransferase ChuW/HutW [uncultured Desulfovibrio sp.]